MNSHLYLKAYATENHACPGVCVITMDADLLQRIQTLQGMVREFSMECIGDQCHATWGESEWESQFMLAAPQLFATDRQCWWTVEVITETGTATFYTERVLIDRLIEACAQCTQAVLYYTEDDNSESVAQRQQRFQTQVDEI